MKTGILFDLDGTLLDTLENLKDAVNHTLKEFGYPERSLEEIRKFVGNGALPLIARSVPEGVDPLPVFAAYKPYYDAHCQVKTKPYDGIPGALEALKGKYTIGIVSNKPDPAVKILCADYFPGFYALGEQPDCPPKPAPDMVHLAMEELGLDGCVYVGDSEVDILTASNAGVECLSVLWGFRNREELERAGGTHFCESPDALAAVLEEMLHGQ